MCEQIHLLTRDENFFSTAFVNTEVIRGVTLLTIASNWWVFLASTLPLTILTLYIWWFWVQKQAHGRYPKWFEILRAGLKRSFALRRLRRSNSQSQELPTGASEK